MTECCFDSRMAVALSGKVKASIIHTPPDYMEFITDRHVLEVPDAGMSFLYNNDLWKEEYVVINREPVEGGFLIKAQRKEIWDEKFKYDIG